MFKLNVKHTDKETIKERLNVVETPQYKYVLTDDKELVEDDKINIVFPLSETEQVSSLLNWIVKGEELYITGYNQYGQKRVESRNIHYVIGEEEEVYCVLYQTKLIVKLKLYELEELLLSKDFIRISKYCLVNIGKIEYIRSLLNSKLDLEMKNGDHVEVNRSDLKDFNSALEL